MAITPYNGPMNIYTHWFYRYRTILAIRSLLRLELDYFSSNQISIMESLSTYLHGYTLIYINQPFLSNIVELNSLIFIAYVYLHTSHVTTSPSCCHSRTKYSICSLSIVNKKNTIRYSSRLINYEILEFTFQVYQSCSIPI